MIRKHKRIAMTKGSLKRLLRTGGVMAKSKEYMALYRARGYGDWFESLATLRTSRGEVKVIRSRISKNNSPVDKTITPNRIYAQVDHRGYITKLFFFDKNAEYVEMWDTGGTKSSHRHTSGANSGFHRHVGKDHGNGVALTKAEKQYAREVDRKWRGRRKARQH